MTELKCIHRHTIRTHPNCFKLGLIKYNWWEGKTIGFFDIETTGLQADFDIMLTYSLKEYKNNKIISNVITKNEIFDGVIDKRLVSNLLDDLKKFDIIVTYNGTRFDIPFTRARADYFNLQFPKFGEKYQWDLYFHVKRLYRIRSKSLESISKFLKIPGKTRLDPEIWRKARYGDKKSIDIILDHNKYDVIVLEKLYERIKGYSKWLRKPI
jgi:hypothetical protein